MKPNSSPTRGRSVWIVFGVALALRLIHLSAHFGTPLSEYPILDARYYDSQAQLIAGGKLLGGDTAFFFGPLYSYLLGGLYALAGRRLWLVYLLQHVLGAASCAFVYTLGRRLFNLRVGVIAAIGFGLCGIVVFYESLLLMTSVVLFLHLALVMVLCRLTDHVGARHASPTLGWMVLAGFLLGLDILARANIILFGLLVAIYLILRRNVPTGRRIALVSVFLGTAILTVTPCTIRNYIVAHDFVPLTSNLGFNFYLGNAEQALGDRPFVVAADREVTISETARISGAEYANREAGRELKPSEVSRFWLKLGLDNVAVDPKSFAIVIARKALLFINGYDLPQLYDYHFLRWGLGPQWLLPITSQLLIPLGLVGMVLARRRWRQVLPLYLLVLGLGLSLLPFFMTARYRVPILPVWAIFAGVCFDRTLSALAQRSNRRSVAIGVGVLVTMIICNLTVIRRYLPDFGENVLGVCSYRAGRTDDAIGHFERATIVNPDFGNAWNSLGYVLLQSGRSREAVPALLRAVKLGPGFSHPHLNLGDAYYALNMVDEACREYRTALRLRPTYPPAQERAKRCPPPDADTEQKPPG